MRTPGFDKFVWNKFEQLNEVKLAPKGWSTWTCGIILYPQPIKSLFDVMLKSYQIKYILVYT
jgi:hypothetical protein